MSALSYTDYNILLILFQIVGCFGKSRYIIFAMYLDIMFISVHSKIYISRFAKITYILKQGSSQF
jgi:hypothetical protein